MKTKAAASKIPPRIVRHEESLKSRQYRGIWVRVLYECEGLQILRTEMEPDSVFDDPDVMHLTGIHFVIDGSPVFRVANQRTDLMPGDSIALHNGQPCTVSNLTNSRSSILSFLFKDTSSCRSAAGAFGRTARSSDSEKEVSR
jgi:hypothetical protein